MGLHAAHLTASMYNRNHPIFHYQEAVEILKGAARASRVLSQMVEQGIVSRLKSGVFRLVPFELGFEKEYLGNPYLVAREIILHKNKVKKKYYLSHASAFDLHQMTTQPQLIVYTSSTKMMRNKIIQGTEFKFVLCKANDIFGLTEMWLDKNEKVMVSDLERSLLDGLKQPEYCGGFSEVAKAFWMKRDLINPQKIIDYAIKLNIGAVNRRLGYLMELYHIGTRIYWEFLQTTLSLTYQLLDPTLLAEGSYISKWKLRLNISEEELLALRVT